MAAQRPGTFSVILQLGNPVFIVVAIVLPNAALGAAMASGSLMLLHYVHIMDGALWTGIDLFMGFVVGPVLGKIAPPQRAEVFKRLIPKMTFLMPMLSGVTIVAGVTLANRLGEIRIFKQLVSAASDVDRIVALGMQNARLAGIQGLLQLAIIFVMSNLRF